MLSRDELRRLSTGSGGSFIFDLSKIRHTHYEPLMKGLENFGIHMVYKLTFNVDLNKNFSKAAELKPVITYSIATVVPKYFKRLVLLLKRMLAESTILKEVHFEGIKIPKKELESISHVLTKPSSLELIEFKDIPIPDKDVSALFRSFGSSKIPDIVFTNCEITDESTDAIVEYLNKYTATHGIKKIPKISLPNNSISKYAIKQIMKASHQRIDSDSSGSDCSSVGIIVPMNDLINENNQQSEIKQIKEEVITPIELDPAFANFFGTKIKLKNYGDLPDQILMTENERMKVQIQRLKSLIDEVNNNDALFIVGDGVYDVTEFMKAIEKRLNSII